MINFVSLANSTILRGFEKNIVNVFSYKTFNPKALGSGIIAYPYRCSLTKNRITGEIYYIPSLYNYLNNRDTRIFGGTIYLPPIKHLTEDGNSFYGLKQLFLDDKNKNYLKTTIYFPTESSALDFIEKNNFPELPNNVALSPSEFKHLDLNNNIYVYLKE